MFTPRNRYSDWLYVSAVTKKKAVAAKCLHHTYRAVIWHVTIGLHRFNICSSRTTRSQDHWSLLSWHTSETIAVCHTSGLWRVLPLSPKLLSIPNTRHARWLDFLYAKLSCIDFARFGTAKQPWLSPADYVIWDVTQWRVCQKNREDVDSVRQWDTCFRELLSSDN